jgi:predicted DNA-binding transcriptional regulator YafY
VTELDEVQPPRDELVRRRWLSGRKVEYARKVHAVLVEHGSVHSQQLYATRHKARWKARYLIGLLVDLHLCQRWELREHVENTPAGYRWAVEYLGERT